MKPYAPIESLLPAARAKRLIDRAATVAAELLLSSDDGSFAERSALTRELESILLLRRNFTASALAPAQDRPAKQYLDSYQRKLEELPLAARPGAALVQGGEVRAWRRLKRQERQMEAEDEFRSAFNAYTTALGFDGGSYIMTAPREVRSRLIREDRLPDVKTVIASDMGMRYLYRNEVLTAIEDARAELRYQQTLKVIEVNDMLDLLRGAQAACDRWFGLIEDSDVKNALNVVDRETRNGWTDIWLD